MGLADCRRWWSQSSYDWLRDAVKLMLVGRLAGLLPLVYEGPMIDLCDLIIEVLEQISGMLLTQKIGETDHVIANRVMAARACAVTRPM